MAHGKCETPCVYANTIVVHTPRRAKKADARLRVPILPSRRTCESLLSRLSRFNAHDLKKQHMQKEQTQEKGNARMRFGHENATSRLFPSSLLSYIVLDYSVLLLLLSLPEKKYNARVDPQRRRRKR
jgi:hypothetical protein